jgi:hypothetical protein
MDIYRFVPESIDNQGEPNLENVSLVVAVVDEIKSNIPWVALSDPDAIDKPTRYLVSPSAHFNGGRHCLL